MPEKLGSFNPEHNESREDREDEKEYEDKDLRKQIIFYRGQMKKKVDASEEWLAQIGQEAREAIEELYARDGGYPYKKEREQENERIAKEAYKIWNKDYMPVQEQITQELEKAKQNSNYVYMLVDERDENHQKFSKEPHLDFFSSRASGAGTIIELGYFLDIGESIVEKKFGAIDHEEWKKGDSKAVNFYVVLTLKKRGADGKMEEKELIKSWQDSGECKRIMSLPEEDLIKMINKGREKYQGSSEILTDLVTCESRYERRDFLASLTDEELKKICDYFRVSKCESRKDSEDAVLRALSYARIEDEHRR